MRVGEDGGKSSRSPFCKKIFFVSRFRRRVEEERIGEKRGSCDSVAVRAHIVKRHFILIQS
jgi:hypothetical protein